MSINENEWKNFYDSPNLSEVVTEV